MGRLNLAWGDRLRVAASSARARLRPATRHVATLSALSIVEVSDARPAAGALFARTFSAAVPDFPRHFVILPNDDRAAPAMGYIHYTPCGEGWLAGGLVADAMRFRQLDAATAEAVRREGGFAEWLMRASCAALDGAAVFALIGDRRSEAVNVRVGFEKTRHPHLFVLWKRAWDARSKERLVNRVLAVGPF